MNSSVRLNVNSLIIELHNTIAVSGEARCIFLFNYLFVDVEKLLV